MLFYILFIIVGIILDQFTKYLAITFLSPVATVPIIPHVFHLTYVSNRGAAFSILEGKQTFLIIMTVIFIVALIYFFTVIPKTRKYYDVNFALSMIISGAFGNLIDRIRLQYVVDFLDIRLIGFAIFNIADIFVVVGCFLIIIALFRNKEFLNEVTYSPPKSFHQKKINSKKAISNSTGLHKDVLSGQLIKPKENTRNLEPKIMTEIRELSKHPDAVNFDPTPPDSKQFCIYNNSTTKNPKD
ncbi:MAG: signal peptidase II [Eubacterium sp.]